MEGTIKLCLVREAGTTKAHGIFWAGSPADLWDAVDEMADPVHFERAGIEMASGVWRDDTLAEALDIPDLDSAPEPADGEDAVDAALTKALDFGFGKFGDHYWCMMVHQGEHGWTRFDAADEGVGVIVRIFEEVHARGAAKGSRSRPKH